MTSSAEFISKEVVRCLQLAEGGIHAVLFVLSVRNQVTEKEDEVLDTLEDLFGSDIFDYLIVFFTGGDVLEENGETIESYLDRCPDFLKDLCNNRMVVFDNKTKNEGKQTKQFQELLNNIDLIRKHTDNKPYTDDIYGHKITEETDRNKKEHEELEKKEVTKEEFNELRKALQLRNEENLKAIAKEIEKVIRKNVEPREEFSIRELEEKHFRPVITDNVLSQMRSKIEAKKAREAKHHAEDEMHLMEMQNEIDQMQTIDLRKLNMRKA